MVDKRKKKGKPGGPPLKQPTEIILPGGGRLLLSTGPGMRAVRMGEVPAAGAIFETTLPTGEMKRVYEFPKVSLEGLQTILPQIKPPEVPTPLPETSGWATFGPGFAEPGTFLLPKEAGGAIYRRDIRKPGGIGEIALPGIPTPTPEEQKEKEEAQAKLQTKRLAQLKANPIEFISKLETKMGQLGLSEDLRTGHRANLASLMVEAGVDPGAAMMYYSGGARALPQVAQYLSIQKRTELEETGQLQRLAFTLGAREQARARAFLLDEATLSGIASRTKKWGYAIIAEDGSIKFNPVIVRKGFWKREPDKLWKAGDIDSSKVITYDRRTGIAYEGYGPLSLSEVRSKKAAPIGGTEAEVGMKAQPERATADEFSSAIQAAKRLTSGTPR